ncbi:hypothetical protein D3C78_1972840 [compost metagenome]
MDIGVSCVGAELQAEVAVAAVCLQRIVGKANHARQPARHGVGQAKALIEQ